MGSDRFRELFKPEVSEIEMKMSEENSSEEPTMEEILASIRKIISEDDDVPEETPAVEKPEPKPEPVAEVEPEPEPVVESEPEVEVED